MKEEISHIGTESIERTRFTPHQEEFGRVINESGLVEYGGEVIVRVQEKAEWIRNDADKVLKHVTGDSTENVALMEKLGVNGKLATTNERVDTLVETTKKEIRDITGKRQHEELSSIE